MSTSRGTLVAFEGIDGSGKSTQVGEVEKALMEQGVKVDVLRFPDRTTPVGKMLAQYLAGEADMSARVAHQLFAANRSELKTQIEALLAIGRTVLLDRYYASGTAYSVAKGLDRAWCEAVDHGMPAPDHVFWLQVPVDVAVARLWARPDRQEIHDRSDLLERADEVYLEMAMERPGVWTPVDGTLLAAEVTLAILDNFEPTTDADLGRLGQ
jgi:dTMP kinase